MDDNTQQPINDDPALGDQNSPVLPTEQDLLIPANEEVAIPTEENSQEDQATPASIEETPTEESEESLPEVTDETESFESAVGDTGQDQ